MPNAVTLTTLVARQVSEDKAPVMIFNDRLKDGRRSLKVWGWSLSDFEYAKQLLEQKGCNVVLTGPVTRLNCSTYRLHVTEPSSN